MKIKIGFFMDVNFNRGGAPISTKVLAEGIAKKSEYECCIVKPKNLDEIKLDNIKIIPIESFYNEFPFMLLHPIKWLKLCFEIRKNIKIENYNIIHANMPFSGMAIGFLKKLKLFPKNISLVYTDREHVADLKWYHRIRYKFFIANEFDKIITISEKSRLYWDKIRKNKNTSTIYNTATPMYEQLITQLNEKKELEILFVGRVVKDKNWELAIKIAENLTNCHIVFILAYFNEEQKEKAEIIYKRLEKYPNIEIKYNLNVENIREYYAKSDIFVMTSSREAFGRTGVEAMSQKTVVIGTNIGGIPEVIGKKQNILNLDYNEFIKRIHYYDENRNELEKDKEFFYKRYKNNFSGEAYISNYDRVYKEMVRMNEK